MTIEEERPPFTFLDIAELIADLEKEWPWPYTKAELGSISSLLVEEQRETSAKLIVANARVFIAKIWSRRAGHPGKHHAEAEAIKIWKAALALKAAFEAAGHEAHELLFRCNLFRDPEMSSLFLRISVERFVHAHKKQTAQIAENKDRERRGRGANTHYRDFLVSLRKIYLGAAIVRARGFPAFRSEALKPLFDLGVQNLGEKGWQDAEAGRKAGLKRKTSSIDPGDA